MDFGNPFITQAERTDIVVKLYASLQTIPTSICIA